MHNGFGFQSTRIPNKERRKSEHYNLTAVISVFPSKSISLRKSNRISLITAMTFLVNPV